jgi:hypothetical protein
MYIYVVQQKSYVRPSSLERHHFSWKRIKKQGYRFVRSRATCLYQLVHSRSKENNHCLSSKSNKKTRYNSILKGILFNITEGISLILAFSPIAILRPSKNSKSGNPYINITCFTTFTLNSYTCLESKRGCTDVDNRLMNFCT